MFTNYSPKVMPFMR